MAKKKSASVQRGQVKLREKKLKDGSSTMAKKKSASVQRGQVKLREKKLKDGSSSLYLDINPLLYLLIS